MFPHAAVCGYFQGQVDAHATLKLRVADKAGRTILCDSPSSPSNAVTDLCRGLILDDRMDIVAACMPRIPLLDSQAKFDSSKQYRCLEKRDGTYIQVYRFRGKMHLSTRHDLDAELVREDVLQTLGVDDASFEHIFTDAFERFNCHTLWFEYTSPHHRIVTLYRERSVTLLGGYLTTGEEMDDDGQLTLAEYLTTVHMCSVNISRRHLVATRAELDSLIASDATHLAEGFVMFIDGARFKYINPKWMSRQLSTQDLSIQKLLHNVLFRRQDVMDLMQAQPEMAAIYQPVLDAVTHVNRRLQELWTMCRGMSQREKYLAAMTQIDGMPLFDWFSRDSYQSPTFVDELRNNATATMKRRIAVIEQLDLLPRQTIIPEEWTVFGCQDSTDVDVFIFVREPDKLSLQYDAAYFERMFPGRQIDLNVGLIRKTRGRWYVKQTTKGAANATHNIVLATARSATPLTDPVEQSVDDMTRSIATHAIRFMHHLLPSEAYVRERSRRNNVFSAAKLSQGVRILRMVDTPVDTPEWRSELKAITMKLLQLLLYHHDRSEEYHKVHLARVCALKFPELSEQALLWYLFRGTRGSYSGMGDFQQAVTRYEEIVRESARPELVWSRLPLVTANPCPHTLDNAIFDMFMEHPAVCTAEFATRFHLVHGESREVVQRIFETDNSPAHTVPDELHRLHIDVVQGGAEWLRLQRHYNAQSLADKSDGDALSTEHPLGFAAAYYTVLRGHIIEAIASNSIQESNHYAVRVGMLVDETTSEAISPDLLLVSTDRRCVIVYEIKGVFGTKHSAAYQRSMWLATRQLTRAAKLIRGCGIEVAVRVVLVYVSDSGLLAEQANLDI